MTPQTPAPPRHRGCRWALLGFLLAVPVVTVAVPAAAATVDADPAVDPRPQLVELQLAGADDRALVHTEAFLAADPAGARSLGLHYLRAQLLSRLGRRGEAAGALAAAIAAEPELAPWARLRLAELESHGEHPELAAGLLANLLASNPPPALWPAAVRLLSSALARGGDCRLARLPALPLAELERRQLAASRAHCAARADRAPADREADRRLLLEATDDEVAWSIADRLAGELVPRADRALAGLVGQALYAHRDFLRAVPFLREGLRAEGLTPAVRDELLYALGRSHFWLGEHLEAARRFAELAAAAADAETRGRARYQQGRALELAGDASAAQSYAAAWSVAPASEWAPLAHLAVLRLARQAGDEARVEAERAALAGRPAWREALGHGALFLVADTLAQRRTDGVDELLEQAAKGRRPSAEVAYWRGRLAELRAEPRAAVRWFLDAVLEDAAQPYAALAAGRLAAPALAEYARVHAVELSRRGTPRELFAAWRMLGPDEPRGVAARRALERSLAADRVAGRWLALAPLTVADWPLWSRRLLRAEDKLLALGLFEEAAAVMLQHFPLTDPAAALTASELLASRGAYRRSLYVAEVLARRAPAQVPHELLSRRLRERLHPLAFEQPLRAAAAAAGVDPFLLAALVREESRFDPRATSAVKARGLAQLVAATAERMAGALGLPLPTPDDLHRPELSLQLGAHYLAELLARYGGGASAEIAAVAAYNAGEAQADQWWRSCRERDDPAELLAKITFRETRHYVTRVLASRAHYTELYASVPTVQP